MLVESVPSTRRFGLASWPEAVVALLLLQAAVSATLPDGKARTVCRMLFYGLVLVLAAGITTHNAVRSRGAIRLFWSFLAASLGVLSLNPWIWLYYTRQGTRPPDLAAGVPLVLHIVLMIAAVASRPHLPVSRQRGRRTTLNFLLLLFFWVFVYAMILVHLQYPSWGSAIMLRFETFYLGENFFLLAILGVLTFRTPPPWKSIYGHFLGASVLYVIAFLATNIPYALGEYHPGLVDLPLTASACWFIWMALRGRKLASQLEQAVQPDTSDTKYLSLLAMLSVVAIPMVGLWELFRTDEPYRTHHTRLLIVLLAVLFLGVGVFVEEYLTNRELFSKAGLANERFRMAAGAGKMYAFEWDVETDLNTRSEEYVDVLGPDEPRKISGQQMLAFVHPDDRAQFLDSLRRLSPGKPTSECSYRVVRADGSVIWLGRRVRAFFDQQGKMLRMVGMVADVSESKRQETLLRESEERLRVAAEVGRMYAWEWDPVTDSVQRSAECAGILGLSEAAGEGIARDYFSSIHPEDRSGLWYLVGSLTPENPVYRTQYRRFRPDGLLLWLEESGCATFDGDGKMVRLIGMTADITERKQAEEALRESEARLHLAAQAGRMYAFEWDAARDVILRSEEHANILGLTGVAASGSYQEFLSRIHPDDRLSHIAAIDGLTPEQPTTQISYRVPRSDGTVVWLETSARGFFDAQGKISRAVGMVADITERKLAEEALADLSHRLIDAQEQERRRIARELHDNTNQRLALLAMKIEQLKHDRPEHAVDHGRIDELRKETVEISDGIRNMAYELHPSVLEYVGLVGTATGFCQEFGKQQNVQVDWQTYDVPSRLPADISLCLFRVLQEALHNSVKHSGARRFEVELWGTPGEIHLTVSDCGVGFRPEAARESRGLGLISMQERVRLVKGTFSIESQPQLGTTIHVRVPHHAEIDSMRAVV